MRRSTKAPSIAIVKSDFRSHSESWEKCWINILSVRDTPFELIDWRERDSLSRLAKNDVVLWSFSHYSSAERRHARDFLFALEQAGVRVFPGYADAWHFDDKLAQSRLFHALDIPTPSNVVLYSRQDVREWCNDVGEFPVVAKLASGSGSHNVTIIKDRRALDRYARRAFGRGLAPQPSVSLKISSNIRSARSVKQLWGRAKRLPDFLVTLAKSRGLDRERGYVYLQEFVPGAMHDLKIVIVNNKLGFIVRNVRVGDFRASGGGSLNYDRSFINQRIIDAAFRLYDAMGALCTGMDIILGKNGEPLIIETSYGFSATAMKAGGGWFDRVGSWHDEPLDAPREVLETLLDEAKVAAR